MNLISATMVASGFAFAAGVLEVLEARGDGGIETRTGLRRVGGAVVAIGALLLAADWASEVAQHALREAPERLSSAQLANVGAILRELLELARAFAGA